MNHHHKLIHLNIFICCLLGTIGLLWVPSLFAQQPHPSTPIIHSQQTTYDISLDKVDSDFNTIRRPGNVITYYLFVDNFGTMTATNVVITETLPDYTSFYPSGSSEGWQSVSGTNLYTINLGTLAPLENIGKFARFTVIIDNPLPDDINQITNQATTNMAEFDADFSNNTDSAVVNVQNVFDIQLTKSNNGGIVGPGNVIPYILQVDNLGSRLATGVIITETVPKNTRFNSARSSFGWLNCPDRAVAGTICHYRLPLNLEVNNNWQIDFAVTVDDNLPSNVLAITNTAQVMDDGIHGIDIQPANNLATIVTLRQQPEVDLRLEKLDGGVTVQRGDQLTYTLRYLNSGNVPATGVIITETLPNYTSFIGLSSWTQVDNSNQYIYQIGLLPNDITDIRTLTLTVQVEEQISDSITSLQNNAIIADDGLSGVETNIANNLAQVTTPLTATPPLTGGPDLAIFKVDGGIVAQPGQQVTYNFVYANIGNRSATGVVISEMLPQQTRFYKGTPGWKQVGNTNQYLYLVKDQLPAGFFSTQPLTLTLLVDDPAPNLTTLQNSVLIQDDGLNGTEQNPTNNFFTLITPVTDTVLPDLQLTKTDGGVVGRPGQEIVYHLTVENIGQQKASQVVITETVPNYTTFDAIASRPTLWNCPHGAVAGSVCEHTITGNISERGGTARARFAVKVDETLPLDTVLQTTNRALVADDSQHGTEPNLANNNSNITTIILAQKPIKKTYLPTISTGGNDLRIQAVTISNSHPQTGEPIDITVTLANQGQPLTIPFWVDLYLASQPIQPMVNQSWQAGFDNPTQVNNRIVPYGIAWRVYNMPTGSYQLTNQQPNDIQDPLRNYSNFIPNTIGDWPKYWNGIPVNNYFTKPGIYYLYVLVDSFDTNNHSDGTIKEINETNNLYGPIMITVDGSALPQMITPHKNHITFNKKANIRPAIQP